MSGPTLGQTELPGAQVVHTTPWAIEVEYNDGIVWIPRRAVIGGRNMEIGDDEVIVADWWLEKKGLL